MPESKRFNLLDDPWIDVVRKGGKPDRLSLLDTLTQSHDLIGLAQVRASEQVALLRFLMAFSYASLQGPVTAREALATLKAGQFDGAQFHAYADKWRHRFYLDGDEPFYQTPTLSKSLDGGTEEFAHIAEATTTLDRFSGGRPVFSVRSSDARYTAPEVTLWLLVSQSMAPGGLVSEPAEAAEERKRKKESKQGAKGALAQGGAWVHPLGANVFETLCLNLVPLETGARVPLGTPAWERPVTDYRWELRSPDGILDLLTWQARRIRVVVEPDTSARLVMVAPGDTTPEGVRITSERWMPWVEETSGKGEVVFGRCKYNLKAPWTTLGAIIPNATPQLDPKKERRVHAADSSAWASTVNRSLGRKSAAFLYGGILWGKASADDERFTVLVSPMGILPGGTDESARGVLSAATSGAMEAVNATIKAEKDIWKSVYGTPKKKKSKPPEAALSAVRDSGDAVVDRLITQWLIDQVNGTPDTKPLPELLRDALLEMFDERLDELPPDAWSPNRKPCLGPVAAMTRGQIRSALTPADKTNNQRKKS